MLPCWSSKRALNRPSASQCVSNLTRLVFSIDRMNVAWTFSHVFKKVLKRLKPSSANSNASCAIQVVILVVLVVASTLNVLPALVLWRPTVADATTMLEWSAILGRLVRRHDSTPRKLDCDRAAWRPQSSGCSHYCIRHRKLVQHF